jgi:hypothetical protein
VFAGTVAVESLAGVAESLLVGEFAVEGGVGPTGLQTQIVVGGKVVGGGAVARSYPGGCAVQLVSALMLAE